MADEDRTFSPTEAQANRTRMQGGGVGQQKMDLQRDPTRPQTAEQYAFTDNPQEDGGDPSGGMETGSTHANRPDKTEAQRGQGEKTRDANKKIARGEPGYGPAGG